MPRASAMESESLPTRSRTARLLAPLLIAMLVALPIWAFSWGAARTAPHELPIGVAGPPAATAVLGQKLAAGDAFHVYHYANEAAARQAIEDRDIYGAFIIDPRALTLLTASAASPVVADLLHQAAAGPAEPTHTVDVVSASPQDPKGLALGSAVLPLVIVSVLVGVIVYLTTRTVWGRAAGLIGGAVLAGLVVTGIVQGWLGVLEGPWYVNTAVFSLIVAAIASVEMGVEMLFGPISLAVVAPLMVFIGNPWSGGPTAPELLPAPAGVIGQLLPPGAGVNLLRSTAFFDGRGGAEHLAVLLVWSALGFGAMAIAGWRRHRSAQLPLTAAAASQPISSDTADVVYGSAPTQQTEYPGG